MAEDTVLLDAVRGLVLGHVAANPSRLMVLGLCGSQGSGKSTLSARLQGDLTARGWPTAVLSLDDIYKTRAERQAMARALHPLLRTRGVPGTHDVSLALEVIHALERGEAVALPRFDKAADDRADPARWPVAAADTRILIFEGWCVGARPAAGPEDTAPINALEASEDPQGRWRQMVEQALLAYQALFSRLDALVLLAAPDFDVVIGWRVQQERDLRAAGRTTMSDEEIAVFIQHYERLTRRILADMPGYADLVIKLDRDRAPRTIHRPHRSA